MKTSCIKNYLIIILILFQFTSCSEEETITDPIIGEWKLISMQIENNVFSQQNECTSKSSRIYYDNGNALEKSYSNSINIPCYLTERQYTWRNTGNNTYLFGTQEIKSEFSDNNTIHIQTTESFDPVQNKNVVVILTYKKI